MTSIDLPDRLPAPRPDRRAARLLRRRRPRDPDRRAGARALSARRSMSATRSSTTASSSTGCAAMGAVFVEELDEVPDGRPVVFSAHGVPKSVPAAAERARPRLSRRDLPAGLQGPSPGRAADRGRAPHPVHRPCRPSRGDRHLRPGARGPMTLIETARGAPTLARRRPGQSRLPDPDHAVGRRHGGDRRAR